MTRLSVIGQVTSLWLAVYGPCFTTPHRRHIILTTSEVAMVVGIREIIACVPKSHQRQTIVANDALLYTDRLELLPSMDRIYGGLGASNDWD